MGGKDKKGQRTKGNVKPSSSGRSAELLGTTTGFIGFSGVPEGSYVPAVNVLSHFPNDDAELDISPDFRMTLRKMGKKDGTTKIKALQEFIEQCEQSSIDVLKSVLPFWPRIFTRLTVDGDRKVRENAAKAHSLYAIRLGRSLAPHLKDLMGAWYTSQCDTYTPASSVAVNSLKTCFPDKKLSNAVTFCHDEIMDFIYDSVFKDEQVSADQKERILVGALAGYSLLLQQICCDGCDEEKVTAKHTQFWKNSKLYRVVQKESSPLVKQAWFGLVYSLAEFMPYFTQENANKLLPSIFGFLDDSESTTLPSLWETILKLLLIVEKASTYVNIPSHLTQRFLSLLASGCHGNSHKIGAVVLRLIRILREYAQRKYDFDQQIISCLCKGFTVRAVTTSSTEALALSTCLFQTMEYIAKSTQESSHITTLFQTQVIPLLDSLVKSPTSNPPMCAVLRHMSTTLYSWCDIDDCDLIDDLWSVLESFLTSLLNEDPHPDPFVIDQIGWIIFTLMDPNFKPDRTTRPAVRAARIRFADSEVDSVSTPIPVPDRLNKKLINFLGSFVCPKTMKYCQENHCRSCLNILSSLCCHDDQIIELFLKSERRTPQEMISQCIQPMLETFHDSHSAALLFSILNAVDSSVRLKLLEDVIENESTAVALSTTALEKFSQKETVIEWLQCEQVGNLLKNVSLKLITTDCSENDQAFWNLIEAAFKTNKSSTSKELLLPESHINGILDTFSSHLSEENITPQLLQRFCNSLLNAWKVTGSSIHRLPSATGFLDVIIETVCSITLIPSECIEDLLDIWWHGAASAIENRSRTAVGIIKRKMLANPDDEIVDRIVGVFQHFAKSMKNDKDLYGSLCGWLVPTSAEWKLLMNEINATHLTVKECLIDGSLSFSTNSTIRSVNTKTWSGLIKVAYVVSFVSVDSLCTSEDEESINVLANLHYASGAADLLLSLFARRFKTSELQSIEHFNQLLKNHLDRVMSKCSSSGKTNLCRKALANARNSRSIWLFCWKKLQLVCEFHLSEDEETILELPYSTMNNEKRNLVLQNQMATLMSIEGSEWSDHHELLATIRILLQDLKEEADSRTIESAVHLVGILQNWQKQHSQDFLFGSNLKETSVSDTVLTVIEIIRFMSLMVEMFPQQLVDSLWDFILCSMASWSSTLEDSWSDISSVQMNNAALISFTVALCRLIGSCSATVAASQSAPADAAMNLPVNLVTEWNDVFTEVAFTTIIPIFHRLGRRWTHYANNPLCDWLMEAIVLSLSHAPLQHITLTVDQWSPLLMSKQPLIQLAAYHLIMKLVPSIVATEGELIKDDADEEEEKKGRAPPSALLDVLRNVKLEELEKVRIGDLHIVEPYSEECSHLIAFCLTWELILHMCGCSSSELRYQYATYLTDSGLMSRLMDNIFCIIPHASLQQVDLNQKFTPDVEINVKFIQDLAVEVYSSALKHMPAVVRRWCNNADKRTATFVEKFTSKCVSPALCSSDLERITSSWDNMLVKVRPSAREVIATYKLNEEASIELVIQLPANYPLGSITVEGGRKVGVTANQWRNWMLQLTTFLMHQNGSILDGLTLWKRNVDKRFEGVEECYICYYVLHGSNYQLPKLTCRTCRKKFHSACLYKWFNTSNNSTCPLCRNLF